jgi:hypothetical protein
MPSQSERRIRREAGAMLRRLAAAVDRGELSAPARLRRFLDAAIRAVDHPPK